MTTKHKGTERKLRPNSGSEKFYDKHKIIMCTENVVEVITFACMCTDFSVREHLLFETHYENGYNIPDPRYEQWLDSYHPTKGMRSCTK